MNLRLFLYLFFAVIFLEFISEVKAQPLATVPLTLKNAIEEALNNNPDIKTLEQNQPIAKADITSANLRANPSLNLVGDIIPLSKGETPADKYYGASLQFPLDVHNHRELRVNLAKSLYDVQTNAFLDAKRQLKLKVKIYFYSVLALRDRMELAHTNLQRLNSFVELNKIRATQLQIPKADVTRAEIIRDQYLNDVADLNNSYKSSLIDFQVLLGRKAVSDTIIFDSDVENVVNPSKITVDEAVKSALEKRPDFISFKKQIEAEKANLNLQESLNSYEYSVSADFSTQQRVSFLGASFNISIPYFNKNEGEIEKANAKVTQSELALKALEETIKSEITKSRNEINSLWTIVENEKNNMLPKSEEVLKSVELSYRTGNTTLIDYLEAQRSFIDTRLDYIQNLLRYHLSQETFSSITSMGE